MSRGLGARTWRISWVLTIGIEFALVLAVLGSGIFVYSSEGNTLISQGIDEVVFSARVSAGKLTSEYRSHPNRAPVEDLAYLAVSGSEYVLLATNQGRFIAASGTKPPISPVRGWTNVGRSGWIRYQGIPYLFASAPITVGNVRWKVIFVEGQSHIASLLYTLRIALALGGIVLVMTTLAAVTLIVRRVTNPLRELEKAARTVTLGVDKAAFPNVRSRLSEVKSLTESFNNMLERLSQAQLREREFISNAAHSLRTPIQVIQGNLESLAQRLIGHPGLGSQNLKALTRESQAMATLVDRLLQLSSAESDSSPRMERLDVVGYLERIAGNLRDLCMHHPLVLQTQDLDQRNVMTDPVLLEAALRILAENADAYSSPGSTVVVFAASSKDPYIIRVGIQNQGTPIPPDDLEEIFQRFYRGKRAASSDHYGLGLAIADSIVKRIGAKWNIRSDEDSTVFAIDLPCG